MSKIVVIGSGSQFTEFFLQEIFKFEEFKGCTLALVDRQPERLEQELRLAEALNAAIGWGMKIEGHGERREALPGADFVYCFIAVNHMVTWKKEFELANKHGIYPLEAYTVGAPGLGMSDAPCAGDDGHLRRHGGTLPRGLAAAGQQSAFQNRRGHRAP